MSHSVSGALPNLYHQQQPVQFNLNPVKKRKKKNQIFVADFMKDVEKKRQQYELNKKKSSNLVKKDVDDNDDDKKDNDDNDDDDKNDNDDNDDNVSCKSDMVFNQKNLSQRKQNNVFYNATIHHYHYYPDKKKKNNMVKYEYDDDDPPSNNNNDNNDDDDDDDPPSSNKHNNNNNNADKDNNLNQGRCDVRKFSSISSSSSSSRIIAPYHVGVRRQYQPRKHQQYPNSHYHQNHLKHGNYINHHRQQPQYHRNHFKHGNYINHRRQQPQYHRNYRQQPQYHQNHRQQPQQQPNITHHPKSLLLEHATSRRIPEPQVKYSRQVGGNWKIEIRFCGSIATAQGASKKYASFEAFNILCRKLGLK